MAQTHRGARRRACRDRRRGRRDHGVGGGLYRPGHRRVLRRLRGRSGSRVLAAWLAPRAWREIDYVFLLNEEIRRYGFGFERKHLALLAKQSFQEAEHYELVGRAIESLGGTVPVEVPAEAQPWHRFLWDCLDRHPLAAIAAWNVSETSASAASSRPSGPASDTGSTRSCGSTGGSRRTSGSTSGSVASCCPATPGTTTAPRSCARCAACGTSRGARSLLSRWRPYGSRDSAAGQSGNGRVSASDFPMSCMEKRCLSPRRCGSYGAEHRESPRPGPAP